MDDAVVQAVLRYTTRVAATVGVEGGEELVSAISASTGSSLAPLAGHVLFPLRAVAQHPTATEAARISAMRGVGALFKSGAVTAPSVCTEHLGILALLLEGRIGQQHRPEEVQEATLDAMAGIIASFSEDGRLHLQSCAAPEKSNGSRNASNSSIGGSSSIRDDAGREGGINVARHIRVKALATLTLLIECVNHGVTVASFLPGICSALVRTVRGDAKQGHVVIDAAITALTAAIVSTMSNEAYNVAFPEQQVQEQVEERPLDQDQNGRGRQHVETAAVAASAAAHESSEQKLKVLQTEEWWSATTEEIRSVLEKVSAAAAAHPHWSTRKAFITMAEALLTRSGRPLLLSIPILVEGLVILANDEYPQIVAAAAAVLKQCANNRFESDLVALVKENVLGLAISLPRVVRSKDDAAILRSMQLLSGYIQLLGEQIKVVVISSTHLRKLSAALMNVLELDGSDIRLIAERYAPTRASVGVAATQTRGSGGSGGGNEAVVVESVVNTDVVRAVGARRRQFVAFQSPDVLAAILKTCRLLGFYGDISILGDHFITLFRQVGGSNRKQAGIVLSELLRGAGGVNLDVVPTEGLLSSNSAGGFSGGIAGSSDGGGGVQPRGVNSAGAIQMLAEMAVDEFLSDDVLRLPTCHQEQPNIATTAAVLTHNAQLVTVALEGVAASADAVGPSFEELLLTVMYPLLQKLGSVTAIVAHASLVALDAIRNAVGETSVGTLICNSSDYVINAITLNLRYLELNPHAPMVLRTMLQYSDSRILPLISDSLTEIYEILDTAHPEHVPVFLGILHALVASMESWDESEGGTKLDDSSGGSVDPSTAEADDAAGSNAGSGDDSDGDDGPKLPPPLCMEHQIVTDILERCPHYLGHGVLQCRLAALEIVGRSGNLLKTADNVLLPAIHALWPTLVARLNDADAAVQLVAMRVVAGLAEVSGTFMKLRVTTDAIPSLCKLLRGEASKAATAGATATLTAASGSSGDGAGGAAAGIRGGAASRFARSYKLELGALVALERLSAALQIGGDGSDGMGAVIGAAVGVYLHASQPQELQQHAANLFKALAVDDPDAVWFQLLQLHPPSRQEPQGGGGGGSVSGGGGEGLNIFSPPDAMFRLAKLGLPNPAYSANVDALRKAIAKAANSAAKNSQT